MYMSISAYMYIHIMCKFQKTQKTLVGWQCLMDWFLVGFQPKLPGGGVGRGKTKQNKVTKKRGSLLQRTLVRNERPSLPSRAWRCSDQRLRKVKLEKPFVAEVSFRRKAKKHGKPRSDQ